MAIGPLGQKRKLELLVEAQRFPRPEGKRSNGLVLGRMSAEQLTAYILDQQDRQEK